MGKKMLRSTILQQPHILHQLVIETMKFMPINSTQWQLTQCNI